MKGATSKREILKKKPLRPNVKISNHPITINDSQKYRFFTQNYISEKCFSSILSLALTTNANSTELPIDSKNNNIVRLIYKSVKIVWRISWCFHLPKEIDITLALTEYSTGTLV